MSAHKISVELEVADIELLIAALQLSGSTRNLGRKLGEALVPKLMPQLSPPTPKADDRERRLLEKLHDILGH